MSRRAQTRTMLERTSQPRRAASLFLAPTAPELELCNSPSIPSPIGRSFAWRRAEKCGETFGAVHPLPARMAGPDGRRSQRRLCYLAATASLYRRPSGGCFRGAPSLPYFPCSPSVTRFGAGPAPCGTRRSASHYHPSRSSADLPGTPAKRAPFGSGFPNKNLTRNRRATTAQSAGEIFLRSLRRKHVFDLGSGAHSRRVAQECPEGNPGKYKQGETQWHSTKTKSF